MNRHEALEWAADFIERAKVFDGASLLPAAKLDMISNLANSVVIPDKPSHLYTDPECTGHIQKCADAMKKSSNQAYRNQLKQEIDIHCWHLAGQAAANEPHPPHDVPPKPGSVTDEEDTDTAVGTKSRRSY